MLRITAIPQVDSVTLKLEGKLFEPWCEELRHACASAAEQMAGAVRLDLFDVSFIDQRGAELVRSLVARGFTISRCSNFVSELLNMPGATMNSTASFPETSDLDLIQRIRTGDQRACEELVRNHGGRMLAVARRFFRNEDDASDAVQDAFLSAFGSIARFEGMSSLSTWLHRIVVNACLMKIRKDKHEESIDALLPQFDETGHHRQHPAQWDDPVSAAAERSELQAHVRACIDRLPEQYRSVLLLRDIEELDTAETARLLDCTPNNVKVRLHRARQALRTLLDPAMTGGVSTAQ
jgi:RNA polymerase sigma-70 factor (ECF subfamily)